MFQKKTASMATAPTRTASRPTGGIQTVIAAGVRVEGDLKSRSGVELHGTVQGHVEIAGRLLVRESGCVIGDVRAQDAIVGGTVEGQIVAARRIELGPSARVQGDMQSPVISIAAGAYVQGKVEMTEVSESSYREMAVPAEAAV